MLVTLLSVRPLLEGVVGGDAVAELPCLHLINGSLSLLSAPG